MKNILVRNLLTVSSLLFALFGIAAPVAALPINVAQGKAVTATGAIGIISPAGIVAGFGDATAFPPAPLSSLVDGIYLPEGTGWQSGTVWWDEQNASSLNNIVEIDLNGFFMIDSISIQADNNDEYLISYLNQFGVWVDYAYATAVGGAGMRERAGSVGSFEASAIRIDARAGDGFYSVSEFQAIGQAVPEPSSILLIGVALAWLGFGRSRKA